MATPGRWIAKTVRDKNISVRMKRCGADELETQPVDTKEKAKENDSCASSSGTDCDSLRSLVTASERDDDEGDGEESDASADGGDDDGGESSLGSFVDGADGILAHLDEQDEALQTRNINVSTSPSDTEDTPASDAGSCPSSPPEQQQQQQQQQHQPSARDRAEAAARDAFAGTGCVMGADIEMSDIEEEEDDGGRDNGDDASDGSLFDFGDAIDGEEAIRAFLDGELDDATPPEEQQAVGKRATEAVARSASEGTGWVSGVDSVLSGGDSDDYKDNDEDFINSIGYVEEVDDINVLPDNEGAARLHEDDDNALAAAGAGLILASRDGTMGSRTSSLPEEQQSARERAEAAARDAFAGTGCVVGADIGMSDIEEEEDGGGGDDASDGSLFDFGDVIDGEEAIRAFLDGELDDATPPEEQQQQQAIGKSAAEAAARSAMDSTDWVSNDDVVLSNGDGDDDEEDNNEDFMNSTDHVEEVPRSDNGNDDTDAHDGLINSKDFPEEEIEAARDDGDAAQRDEDTDTTLAAIATPTTTALACSFGSTSSPSPPEEKVTQVNAVEPRNTAALGSSAGTGNLHDSESRGALVGGPSGTSSSRTSDEGFDSGCFQPSSAVTPKCSAPLDDAPPMSPSDVLPKSSAPLEDTSPTTPSSLSSPPVSPPPPLPPSPPSQRLDMPGTVEGGVNAEPPQICTSRSSASGVSNDNSSALLLPSSPPITPVVQAPVSPPPSAQAAQAPVPVSPQPLSPFNPLKGMFSPELDTPNFASSLGDVLYRGGVLPVSAKSRKALKAVGRGEATSDMMEDIIRGMRSAHGKTNLARDNGGAKFVGPNTRTPTYKTGKGLTRLLNEISKRHEVGSKFIVCIDSPEPHQKARVITGTVSAVDQPPTAEPQASSAQGLPPPLTSSACMIHGDGRDATAQDWVDANGDIREGQRLSAWVY